MELRRLHYFVILAKHLHFSRAAQELGIAQPGLSQQIKVLERELKVLLVNRSSGRVELTAAGEALRDGATALLRQADQLREQVRAVANGMDGVLRIAYTRSAADLDLGDITRDFRRQFPRIQVSTATGWTSWNLNMLKEGNIDIAFVRGPVAQEGIKLLPVAKESSIVAVPSAHPLAGRDAVGREELVGYPVVLWGRDSGPEFYDDLIAQTWPSGPPKVVFEEPEAEQILAAVADGVGISVLDERRARKLCPDGVTLIPFADKPPTSTVSLVWLSAKPKLLVTSFVSWYSRRIRD